MNYFEEKIINLKVEFAKDFGESFSLKFNDGSTLSIYNPFSFSGSDLTKLIGVEVDHLEEDANNLSIIFSNGGTLKVGLREEDYINGPEAFVFTVPGGPIMVQRLGDD